MGTRADFYVGKGKDAQWIGSIAWDGYDIPDAIRKATSEADFVKAVLAELQSRDDATFPKDGWPWPWNDSGTTDCSYWFVDGRCFEEYYGHLIPSAVMSELNGEDLSKSEMLKYEPMEYPNMSHLKNVTLGPRSGLIVF